MKIYNPVRCIFLIALAYLFPITTWAFQLQEFDAEYHAFHQKLNVGDAYFKVKALENGSFKMVYQSSVSKFFLSDKRFEESVFRFQDNEFIPQSYYYKRSGTGKNRDLKVTFDAKNNRIWIDEIDTFDWQGELDNQLFRLDLSRSLSENKEITTYNFINYRGEKRQYFIEVLGEEVVGLPYGQIESTKVKIMRESNKRVTYAWFAPALNWTLVRLQQFKNNKEQADIKLAKFKAPGN